MGMLFKGRCLSFYVVLLFLFVLYGAINDEICY